MSVGTVVIVPGIGGNDLFTQPILFGLGASRRLWLDPTALLAGGWRLLGLSADGVTPDVPLTGPLLPGPPLAAYYGVLGEQLNRLGWGVISPVLDWRQTIRRDAERLVQVIRDYRHLAPLHLVGHSRGGLVIRRALEILGAAGELGLIGRCAGLGVPHQGSWSAAGLLALWAHDALLLANAATQVFSLVIGSDLFGQVRSVVVTWPSAYELLPRPAAEGISADQWTACYSASKWAAIRVNASVTWLSQAQLAWASLPEVPAAVQWVDVVGIGLPTADQLVGSLPPAATGNLTWTAPGDGIVPARWATQPGRVKVTTPTSHAALVSDGRIIHVLDQYLRSGLTQDVVIGGPLLQ